jgi:hypothetical protein
VATGVLVRQRTYSQTSCYFQLATCSRNSRSKFDRTSRETRRAACSFVWVDYARRGTALLRCSSSWESLVINSQRRYVYAPRTNFALIARGSVRTTEPSSAFPSNGNTLRYFELNTDANLIERTWFRSEEKDLISLRIPSR